MSVGAASWHRSATGIVAMEECAGHTVKGGEQVRADFVEAYRAMNAGRASERQCQSPEIAGRRSRTHEDMLRFPEAVALVVREVRRRRRA